MKARVLHVDLAGVQSCVLHLWRQRMRDRIAEDGEPDRRIGSTRPRPPIFQIGERVTLSGLFLLHAITTTRASSLACRFESCRSMRSSVASRHYNADCERYFSSFGLYPRHCGGGCSGWKIRTNSDAFSARAERLSPHRPREVDLLSRKSADEYRVNLRAKEEPAAMLHRRRNQKTGVMLIFQWSGSRRAVHAPVAVVA